MSAMADPDFDFAHDIRPLVRRLKKPPSEWRREDLVALCLEDGIRVVNFRYPSFDGKLRELRLPVTSPAYLRRILAAGERVDGSSLFPGLFDAGDSDLYVVPVYRWAFLDPWAADELHIVCRFAGRDGAPAAATPDNLLAATAASCSSASPCSRQRRAPSSRRRSSEGKEDELIVANYFLDRFEATPEVR